MSTFELIGSNGKWSALRETYSVSQCCGGEQAKCHYPGQQPGDGIKLHFVPKKAIDNKNGLIDFKKVESFHIYKSSLEKSKCISEKSAKKILLKAKSFAKKRNLNIKTKNILSFKTPYEDGKIGKCKTKEGMSVCDYKSNKDNWKIKISQGWKPECNDMGCDRYLIVKGSFKNIKFNFQDVYKGNGWQGVNGASYKNGVLLLKPFNAFMEMKIESPRLFYLIHSK